MRIVRKARVSVFLFLVSEFSATALPVWASKNKKHLHEPINKIVRIRRFRLRDYCTTLCRKNQSQTENEKVKMRKGQKS